MNPKELMISKRISRLCFASITLLVLGLAQPTNAEQGAAPEQVTEQAKTPAIDDQNSKYSKPSQDIN